MLGPAALDFTSALYLAEVAHKLSRLPDNGLRDPYLLLGFDREVKLTI